MNLPVLSIVTPSYNQSVFIGETIESVLSQEGDFFIDYIIMDGGSTDGSVDIISEYDTLLKKNSRVKKYNGLSFYIKGEKSFTFNKCRGISYRWFSEKDRGQAHAVNKGMALAKGDIVAFINSDDMYEEFAFKTASRRFARDTGLDVLYGNGLFIDKTGAQLELYYTKDIYKNDIFGECFICQPTVFLKKRVFDAAGPFNERINNSFDYEYWIRLWVSGYTFLMIKNVLAFSRIHERTKTANNRKEIYCEILAINKKYLGRYHKSWTFQLSKEIPLPNKAPVMVVRFLNKLLNGGLKVYIKAASLVYTFMLRKNVQERYNDIFRNT